MTVTADMTLTSVVILRNNVTPMTVVTLRSFVTLTSVVPLTCPLIMTNFRSLISDVTLANVPPRH